MSRKLIIKEIKDGKYLYFTVFDGKHELARFVYKANAHLYIAKKERDNG